MPKIKTDNGNVVKVSLLDVLKSDKTLELEAALRRAKAAKKTAQGNETEEPVASSAERAAIEKTAIQKYLAERAAAKKKAKEKEARERVAAAEREAIERAAIEKYLAEKEAEEKAAKEKEEAEKAAAAAVIERYLAEKAAEEIAAAERAEAIRAAAEKVAAEKLRAEKILTERTESDVITGPSTASTTSSAKAPASYVWTPAQDKRLRELKLADNTWRAISSELEGRPINELKRRWAKIKKTADSSDEESRKSKGSEKTKWKGKGKQKMNSKGKCRRTDSDSSDSASDGEEQGSRSDRSKQKHRVSFAEPLPTSDKNDAPVKEVRKYFYMDDKFTLEEIILLHKLADHYENEKWLRVSSRFFDKTGRRISPDDAKLRVKKDMRED